MATHWLRNHSRYAKKLCYSPSTSTFTHHDASELAEADRTPRPGTWTKADGRIYGISPSAQGPVFFCEGEAYLLEPDAFSVQCARTEEDQIHFMLTVRGEAVIEVLYTPEQDIFFDFFDDDDEDFFEWFSGTITNHGFFELHTRD